LRRALHAISVIVTVLTASVVLSPTEASAAVRNGSCEDGEVCFYYNSSRSGSLYDTNVSMSTYGSGSACTKFVGAGAGKGQCIKNNTASVWNRTASSLRVYYNSYHGAPYQEFRPGPLVGANLNATLKNNNASHLLVSADVTREIHLWADPEGKCLDSNGSGEVYYGWCNGGNYQKWVLRRIEAAGANPLELRNVATNRCLDSNANGDVYTIPCNGGAYQRWHDSSVSDLSARLQSTTLRDRATGRCLYISENPLTWHHVKTGTDCSKGWRRLFESW
jgi:hypothetical protein